MALLGSSNAGLLNLSSLGLLQEMLKPIGELSLSVSTFTAGWLGVVHFKVMQKHFLALRAFYLATIYGTLFA